MIHSINRRAFLSAAATLAAGAAVVPAAARAAAGAAPSARPPNIIFILADDLGYGDLGCYGQKEVQTPNLDRMAREGVRFTQCYAGATVCAPSRCCLMTGLHGGHAFIRGNGKQNLRPTDLTVAEVLKKAGYATGHIGKWGLGHAGSTGVPTRKGFDYFFGYYDHTHAHNYYPTFLMRNETRIPLDNVVPNEGAVGQGKASVRNQYTPDLFTEESLRWIEQNKSKPFFLYLATTIPHANNEGKEMDVPDHGIYKDKDWPEGQKGHAAMITRMDRDVGRILDRLKELGLDDNTIVLFSSDNGPHQEGGFDPDFYKSSGPLRGIKRDLYEGGIRVPMIARWPGTIAPGRVSDQVWAFWDFLPTAAALAGTRIPSGTDGISMLNALLDRPQVNHEFLYWEFHERGFNHAARMGDWKAVRNGVNGPLELYNLKEDLSETRNLAADHPQIVSRIDAYLKTARTPSAAWPIRDPATRPATTRAGRPSRAGSRPASRPRSGAPQTSRSLPQP